VTWLHDTVLLQERWECTAGNVIRRGHYQILLKLLEYGFTWTDDYREITLLAAEGGSVQILELLRARMQPAAWSAAQLTEMLQVAGAYNNVAAAKWLRAQGAAWPAETVYNNLTWKSAPAVYAWAIQEGCTTVD
jgi:hypothetical protein